MQVLLSSCKSCQKRWELGKNLRGNAFADLKKWGMTTSWLSSRNRQWWSQGWDHSELSNCICWLHGIKPTLFHNRTPLSRFAKMGASNYLGQVKEMIKDQMSHLQVWNIHEELWYSTLRESLGARKKRKVITTTGSLMTQAVGLCPFVPPIQISINANECGKSFKVLIWNQFPFVSFLLVNPIAIVSDPSMRYSACDCLWRQSNLRKIWLNLVGWHFPLHRDAMESTQNCHATVFVLSNGCWWILMQLLPLHGMLLLCQGWAVLTWINEPEN
jgi:hypothetical protein